MNSKIKRFIKYLNPYDIRFELVGLIILVLIMFGFAIRPQVYESDWHTDSFYDQHGGAISSYVTKGQHATLILTQLKYSLNVTIWGLQQNSHFVFIYQNNYTIESEQLEFDIPGNFLALMMHAVNPYGHVFSFHYKLIISTASIGYYYATLGYVLVFITIFLILSFARSKPNILDKKLRKATHLSKSLLFESFRYELSSFNYLFFVIIYGLLVLSHEHLGINFLMNWDYTVINRFSSTIFEQLLSSVWLITTASITGFVVVGFAALFLFVDKIRAEIHERDIHEKSLLPPLFSVVLGRSIALTLVVILPVISLNYFLDALLHSILGDPFWVLPRMLVTLGLIAYWFSFSVIYYTFEGFVQPKFKPLLFFGVIALGFSELLDLIFGMDFPFDGVLIHILKVMMNTSPSISTYVLTIFLSVILVLTFCYKLYSFLLTRFT